jgi:class 3 adenylate cyclase
MLAFRRPDDALGCAIDIQRAFDRYNTVNPGAAIRVRIGLHHGTALKHQQDYYGRDVNLAARIADRADGGQILVTAAIREMANSRTGPRFVPSGELELKGLSGKHAAYAVLWDAAPAAAEPAG